MKFLSLILCAMVAGCGQKGPLYLPEETAGEVITRPTPADSVEAPAPEEEGEKDAD